MTSFGASQPSFTESDLVGGLKNLLTRHNVSCGQAGDLAQLVPALSADEEFCGDLFAYCQAIGRLSESVLTPERFFELVACAVTGQGAEPRESLSIPSDLHVAFLTGYAAWLRSKPALAKSPEAEPRSTTESRLPARELVLEEAELRGADGLPGRVPVVELAAAEAVPRHPLTARTMASVRVLSSGEADRYKERIRRLKVMNASLVVLCLAASVSTAAFAYRYLHLKDDYASLAGGVNGLLSSARPPASASPNTPASSIERSFPPSLASPPTASSQAQRASGTATAAAPQPAGRSEKQTEVAQLHTPPVVPPPSVTKPQPAAAVAKPAGTSTPGQSSSGQPSSGLPKRSSSSPPVKVSEPARVALPPAAGTTAAGAVLLPANTVRKFSVSTPAPDFSGVRAGEDKDVNILATISKNGTVKSTRILGGNQNLGLVAARAMRSWQFRPYRVGGKAVEVVTGFSFHVEGH